MQATFPRRLSRKTLPLPCASTVFVASIAPLPCVSTAFVPKTLPLSCLFHCRSWPRQWLCLVLPLPLWRRQWLCLAVLRYQAAVHLSGQSSSGGGDGQLHLHLATMQLYVGNITAGLSHAELHVRLHLLMQNTTAQYVGFVLWDTQVCPRRGAAWQLATRLAR